MAGIFGLSIDPAKYQRGKYWGFGGDLLIGTFYHQGQGEAWSGVSVLDKEGKILKPQTFGGLILPALQNVMDIEGVGGIGYCGDNEEPFNTFSKHGGFSTCFTGNIANYDELRARSLAFGESFQSAEPPDIEIMAHLIGRGDDIVDGLKFMNREIVGAFSILVMTEEGVYAACDPSAYWPLLLGTKEGARAVATESCSFFNTGFKAERQLDPGEIIFLRDGKSKTLGFLKREGAATQHCSFLWVYTLNPTDVIFADGKSLPISEARKNLGRIRARKDIEAGFFPDIVFCSPDSGRFGALGYYWEFIDQARQGKIPRDKIPFFYEVIVKFGPAGRSYLFRTSETREMRAFIKALPVQEEFPGWIAVLVEDSIRRGNVLQQLVSKLLGLGFAEIHVRVTNPESLSPCIRSKTVQQGTEMLAAEMTPEQSAKHLRVNSVMYNSIEDLYEGIGVSREKLCIDCDLRH